MLLDRGQAGGTRPNSVQLRVSCRTLDWQLAALAQLCGVLAPFFARVEGLFFFFLTKRVEGLTLGLHISNPKPVAD
jgi:hypothetical protein